MKILKCLIFIPLFIGVLANANNDSLKHHKWGLSAGLGLNTSSVKSDNAKVPSQQWSISLVRNFKPKKLQFGLVFKLHSFSERFSQLPYYYMDDNRKLVATQYKQINRYHMLGVLWRTTYHLNKKYFIKADLGFDFLLPTSFKRKFSNKTETLRRFEPGNYFFTRPDITIAFGWKKNLGKHEFIIQPVFQYSFTIGYLNLTPNFYSLGLEAQINF